VNSERSNATAAAIILAGGKSSRMGRPKAMLPFDGEPLILHLVRRLKTLFSRIVVVAAPGQELPPMPVTVTRDEVPHQGPVGGIYYGLNEAAPALSFVTSCDAPFLDLTLISHLLSQAPGYDVVVPYWEQRLQPLQAVYRPTVLPFLKEQLERNELRPIFLYDKVRTRKISQEEVRRFDPDGFSFLNMNTGEDYEAALTRWREIRQREETETKNKEQGAETEATPAGSVANLTCTVELFGVARLLAKIPKVSLALPQGATLSDLFSSLAEKLPVLVGQVIQPDGKRLTGGYACNINGRDFVRDPSGKINAGDCVFIISADAGG
jgi:molybdopterin-guanine dinucleotide biosynthesis protein A